MTFVGVSMVALTQVFGHSYVDGVGYGVIQSILDHHMTAGGPPRPPFRHEAAGDDGQPRFRSFGRHLLALALSRRDPRRGVSRLSAAIILPNSGLTAPSAAIVGMAAMVGAGTGGS